MDECISFFDEEIFPNKINLYDNMRQLQDEMRCFMINTT
jgi:hypothetical protein